MKKSSEHSVLCGLSVDKAASGVSDSKIPAALGGECKKIAGKVVGVLVQLSSVLVWILFRPAMTCLAFLLQTYSIRLRRPIWYSFLFFILLIGAFQIFQVTA